MLSKSIHSENKLVVSVADLLGGIAGGYLGLKVRRLTNSIQLFFLNCIAASLRSIAIVAFTAVIGLLSFMIWVFLLKKTYNWFVANFK